MRLYRRSKKVDMIDTINLCDFDADHGRVRLALNRLKDLEDEVGADAKISYAEGLIRKDFLGQGIQAHQLFVHSYEQDSNHAFAACNAADTAPTEQAFRKWAAIAIKLSPEDAPVFLALLDALRDGISYWEVLDNESIKAYQEKKWGSSAAYLELALQLGGMSPDDKVATRRVRAQSLRAKDAEAEQFREASFEAFPPDERLALKEALRELDRALALDEYDPELWNLKSAWCVLMHRFEDAVACADESIKLRPNNYSKPHQNKAIALYNLKRYEEARACADETKVQAENSQAVDDIAEAIKTIEICSTPQKKASLEEVEPIVAKILESAEVTSNHLAGLMKGTIQDLTSGFQARIAIARLDNAPSIEYVAPMGQLLAYLPPETGFCMIHNIGITHPERRTRCLEAALYIAAHGEPIMQRDAARLLLLTIFQAGKGTQIRKAYRLGILEPSAAAKDEMANLNLVVRAELERINPLFAELIADQEPVDAKGRERAARTILANLRGVPFVNTSATFNEQFPMGCIAAFVLIAMVAMVVVIWLIWGG